jgi:DNA-binding transcriptional regulator GbsR (MarR family)
MEMIKAKTNLSIRFINDSIHRLEQFGLIQVTRRKGTSNLYYFPPETDQFEMFSETFLDMDLPPKVKEYYMKLQKTLYDKDQEFAITHYNDSELSKITGLSKPTIKKYNAILENSGYMSTAMTTYKDEAGLSIREMSFDMQKLGQFGL